MAGKLRHLNVIVTRQVNLVDDLKSMILSHSGSCVNLPLFAIESTLNAALLHKIQRNLQLGFLTICISRNAAMQLLSGIALSPNAQWAAIGPATAKYLQDHGIKNIIYPSSAPYDGNALLTELQLKSINLKNLCIMVITGEQGNSWLAENLQHHGAVVEVITVYRRTMPAISVAQFKKIIGALMGPSVFLITCITSLVNLQILASAAGINVYNMSLLVVSNRIHAYAKMQGFVNISIAKSTMVADIESVLLEIGEINVRTITA